jgi:nicotinate-nucleotide pyrophosphorylase (carboxylating)
MDPLIDRRQLEQLLQLARAEDLGPFGDITSRLLPETTYSAIGVWQLVARQAGRFCGLAILPDLLSALAPEVRLEWSDVHAETADVAPGRPVARFRGRVNQMLVAERTILNVLQHLSGIATLTARFVGAVAGTHAKIYDTRKTTPGMRTLEKYAVRCGGGHNHRLGLHDAILIKDNHLAGIPTDRLARVVCDMLSKVQTLPAVPAFVEVECDCLEQLEQLFKVVGIDVVLLDNFSLEDLRAAVQLRDDLGLKGKVELEASGGVTLSTVRMYAETGVERIAVGAITHSAPILDLAIDAV